MTIVLLIRICLTNRISNLRIWDKVLDSEEIIKKTAELVKVSALKTHLFSYAGLYVFQFYFKFYVFEFTPLRRYKIKNVTV